MELCGINGLGKNLATLSSRNAAITHSPQSLQWLISKAPSGVQLSGPCSGKVQELGIWYEACDKNSTGSSTEISYQGPAFDVEHENDVWINNPRLDFDDETVYLAGWHIHTPADHTVNGLRTRAELHLVHKTSNGIDRAIVAVLMDPGSENHTFIDQFPTELIKFNNSDPDKHVNVSLNLNDVLQTASAFKEFWTYEGSVTSPPCNEGVRWFVARPVLYMSNEQMRNILAASAYSSRPEQMVWMHRINE